MSLFDILQMFSDILAKVATLSKQNPKPEPESDIRRRQNANINKENVRPASNDYTKEQLEAVKRQTKILHFRFDRYSDRKR